MHVYAGGLILIFQKEKGNTLTLLIIFIVKSLQKQQNSTNLLLCPHSAGINVQSPQSDSTPKRLALYFKLNCIIILILIFQDQNTLRIPMEVGTKLGKRDFWIFYKRKTTGQTMRRTIKK